MHDQVVPNTDKYRVGIGHDTHRLVSGRDLILGGVRIDHEVGLAGHSDADIVLHALTDAILGAASLGDIGDHFPDTDPAHAGRDSREFLQEAVKLVSAYSFSVVNADLIIHAQQPRLSSYKTAIREVIASLLNVGIDRVNVKAKTGEHVGPIGRCEAMSCHAVVLLRYNCSGDEI